MKEDTFIKIRKKLKSSENCFNCSLFIGNLK